MKQTFNNRYLKKLNRADIFDVWDDRMEWKKTMPEFDNSLALITLPGVDQQHRAADQLISFFFSYYYFILSLVIQPFIIC